jgi:parallel beta-helix repeat protein
VWCEQRLQGARGQRVGLSLGGGGTGAPFCRDRRCIAEQEGGRIESNLIAACSDDGIYLNSAARSTIRQNTLLDTGGIRVRFPASSADVEGNLVDGAIRSSNDGVVRETDNRASSVALLYLGQHPVRRQFSDIGRLAFKEGAARRAQAVSLPPDLCGAVRPSAVRYGATEDFSVCFAPSLP